MTAVKGTNFYRLRMVDRDDAFAYSNIITVKMNVYPNSLSVFPDPASKEIILQLFERGKFTLKLLDANGRMVKTEAIQLSGNGSTILDISDLPGGMYIIILQNAREIQYKKFIKQ